jgi:hypothetical protein
VHRSLKAAGINAPAAHINPSGGFLDTLLSLHAGRREKGKGREEKLKEIPSGVIREWGKRNSPN